MQKVAEKVAVLGLGAMGAGMASNLHQAGLLQATWNRGAARAQAFQLANGVMPAASAEAALVGADVVLSCVSADEDLQGLVSRLADNLAPNTLWIDCSTVAASTAITIAKELAELGHAFLDAPVSGGQEGAENGSLSVMVGGAESAFNRAVPVFTAIAARWQLMGPSGSGQATKAVNQIMAAGMSQAVTEAMSFAQKQGLPIDKVVDVVGSGAAGNWFVNHRGESMVAGDFRPGFKLALHHKDLLICQRMAQQSGAPTAVIERTLADYERLMADGFANEDISALYRLK